MTPFYLYPPWRFTASSTIPDFPPKNFLKSASRSCSPLKLWVGVYPEGKEWIGEALAGVIVSRTLHRLVSKVGLSSVRSLLTPLIETMTWAYPSFRILLLSRSNLWSVTDILTFLDCLDSQYCNEIFVVPLQFQFDIWALGNVCTSFWPFGEWYRG
jgi:hypothetical protein